METATKPKRGKTPQANFRLPTEIVRKIRLEAADRQMYPAQVMTERLRESYERRPLKITT